MDPPTIVSQPEIVNNVNLPVAVPVSTIKTEINEEDKGNPTDNIAIDGSEEVTPSPTTGDEQPLNPWLQVKCILCHLNLSANDEPKLLECLHAACGNCITSKVNEHIPINPDVTGN